MSHNHDRWDRRILKRRHPGKYAVDALQLVGVTISVVQLAAVGCEELKIELTGGTQERPMSDSRPVNNDINDDDDERMGTSVLCSSDDGSVF